jgi:hypothetical protein
LSSLGENAQMMEALAFPAGITVREAVTTEGQEVAVSLGSRNKRSDTIKSKST